MKKILALIIVANFSFIYSACPALGDSGLGEPSDFSDSFGWSTNIWGESDLNRWQATYGDCPSYTLDNLNINNINNTTILEGVFSGLTEIGELSISNANSLTTINDFHNLTHISRGLDITNADNLTSVQGLGENGIYIYALEIINAGSLSNCSDIPLFNCNITLGSGMASMTNTNCDYIDVIGCDGSCGRVNEYSGPSNDLLLTDCNGECGGPKYLANIQHNGCYIDFYSGTVNCQQNPYECSNGHPNNQYCECVFFDNNQGTDESYNNGFSSGAASVDITTDNQASYDAGAASVTPEDGITQETVDAAVAVAEMESYILGAQSGDINGNGYLNVTDIILYVEKILAD
jgi:hypothetical protein